MTEAKTKVNYTDEMVQTVLSMYAELGNEGLEQIAQAVGRPVRSVRSKLVREGVYVAEAKPAKAAKAEGPTKKELLLELESLVNFSVDGLMPATKEAIQLLIAFARQAESNRMALDEAYRDAEEAALG